MNNYMMNLGTTGGGPIMTGTWQNPNTGDVFVVRDQFFDESGNIYVTTQDGRNLQYSQIKDYLQISDSEMSQSKINKIKGVPLVDNSPINPPTSPSKNILEGISVEEGGILPEDIQLLQGNPYAASTTQNNTHASNPNMSIISKAFKDKVDAPDVTLSWNVFPGKQISLLTEVMDIPIEDIAEYIFNEYLQNKEVMITKIKDSLSRK